MLIRSLLFAGLATALLSTASAQSPAAKTGIAVAKSTVAATNFLSLPPPPPTCADYCGNKFLQCRNAGGTLAFCSAQYNMCLTRPCSPPLPNH